MINCLYNLTFAISAPSNCSIQRLVNFLKVSTLSLLFAFLSAATGNAGEQIAGVEGIYKTEKYSHSNHVSRDTSTLTLRVYSGQRLKISLDEICEQISFECSEGSFEVEENPIEGVLFKDKKGRTFFYQHAGTSLSIDSFTLAYKKSDNLGLVRVFLRVSGRAPTVKIMEPLDNQIYNKNTVKVMFGLSGEGADHIHLTINGGEYISLPISQTTYHLEGLKNGRNNVELSLATKNHRVIPNSTARVSFLIQLP